MTDEELTAMNVDPATSIDRVYDWMEQMKRVDTTGVEPMFTPAQHDAPLREDIVTTPNLRDALLANDPDGAGKSRGYFAVPKVIEEEA